MNRSLTCLEEPDLRCYSFVVRLAEAGEQERNKKDATGISHVGTSKIWASSLIAGAARDAGGLSSRGHDPGPEAASRPTAEEEVRRLLTSHHVSCG